VPAFPLVGAPVVLYAPLSLTVSFPPIPTDDRTLDQITFAGDLSDEERDLVLRREGVQAEIRSLEAGARSAEADGKETAWSAHPRLEELKRVLASISEKIEPLRLAREGTAEEIRRLLAEHDIHTAEDIVEAGCTGLFGELSSLELVQRIRDNMGGSQIGLPCYVGADRFCLVHRTIGGLQENQEPKNTKYVSSISRELTDLERGYRKVVEHARRQQGPNRMAAAQEMLREEEERRRKDKNRHGDDSTDGEEVFTEELRDMADYFKCTEHGEFFWGCRFCVAQAIVEGDFEPLFFVKTDDDPGAGEVVAGAAVVDFLENLNNDGVDSATVFAKVAAFRRKLARE